MVIAMKAPPHIAGVQPARPRTLYFRPAPGLTTWRLGNRGIADASQPDVVGCSQVGDNGEATGNRRAALDLPPPRRGGGLRLPAPRRRGRLDTRPDAGRAALRARHHS